MTRKKRDGPLPLVARIRRCHGRHRAYVKASQSAISRVGSQRSQALRRAVPRAPLEAPPGSGTPLCMSDLSAFLAGSCESFQAFAERLRTVARSDATVLLEGE